MIAIGKTQQPPASRALSLGSSIGALNGAFIAAGMPPGELARLWLKVRRQDVMRWNWKGLFRLRRDPGLYTLDPLRELLRRTLPATRFEDLVLPLTITTTDLQLGEAVYWSGSGDLIEPLMLGTRHALMIECVCCQRVPATFTRLLGVLERSLSIAFDGKYSIDLEHAGKSMQLHVVRPELQLDVGLLDFRHTAELIDAGYRQTLEYFRAPGAQKRSSPSTAKELSRST